MDPKGTLLTSCLAQCGTTVTEEHQDIPHFLSGCVGSWHMRPETAVLRSIWAANKLVLSQAWILYDTRHDTLNM